MRKVRGKSKAHQRLDVSSRQIPLAIDDGSVMLSMIQALIPLGLKAVEEAVQQEVTALAGKRYARDEGTPGVARWGRQRGSI